MRIFTLEHRIKLSEAKKKADTVPPSQKGKKHTYISRPNSDRKGKYLGKQNGRWKEDVVGNRALHLWVERQLGKPTKCQFCGKDGLTRCKIHWANKSRKYLRDTNDWLRLCVFCHWHYDRDYKWNKQ